MVDHHQLPSKITHDFIVNILYYLYFIRMREGPLGTICRMKYEIYSISLYLCAKISYTNFL